MERTTPYIRLMERDESTNTRLNGEQSHPADQENLPDGKVRLVLPDELAGFILRESEKRGLTPNEWVTRLLEQHAITNAVRLHEKPTTQA